MWIEKKNEMLSKRILKKKIDTYVNWNKIKIKIENKIVYIKKMINQFFKFCRFYLLSILNVIGTIFIHHG